MPLGPGVGDGVGVGVGVGVTVDGAIVVVEVLLETAGPYGKVGERIIAPRNTRELSLRSETCTKLAGNMPRCGSPNPAG